MFRDQFETRVTLQELEYGDRGYTPVTVSLLAAVVLGRVLGLCKAHRMSVIGRNGRFEEFGAW